ncbi:ATP binding domain 4, partial [Irineochytrium annulatum]
GGKDSCFNMMHCEANGHKIVALANLRPPAAGNKDEIDSFMYQTVGHDAIHLFQECMGLPLFRREIAGKSVQIGSDYDHAASSTSHDEVEDLMELLRDVKKAIPDVEAVSVGAILSNYQRVRVENVLGDLMAEMIDSGLTAILIKVAGMGMSVSEELRLKYSTELKKSHLGKSLGEMHDTFVELNRKYDSHICGEGGEYESLTLDSPLFARSIVIDESETIVHSDDAFAIVAYLRIKRAHTVEKAPADVGLSDALRARLLEGGRNKMVLFEGVQLRDDEGGGGVDVAHVDGGRLGIPKRSVVIKGTVLALSNITTTAFGLRLEEEFKNVMDQIQASLFEHCLSWRDVVKMHVYVRSMSSFGAMNKVYGTFFSLNPATRVTVEVPLAQEVQFQVGCLAVRPDVSPILRRDSMHVQGISYWAPANIGPYSQAVKVFDHLFVAGQIGLVPNTMTMPVGASDLDSCRLEIETSLTSLEAIARAQGCTIRGDAALCVCYVAKVDYMGLAKAYWSMEGTASDCLTLIMEVPTLPRNARVEWEAVFQDNSRYDAMISSIRDEDVEDVEESIDDESMTSRTVESKVVGVENIAH